MQPPIKIEPSLLAGDFGALADEACRAADAGADALHLDVMDGHFVKNLSMGPAVVAAVNRATDCFLDVHLMIYNPFEYIERFIEAGADRLIFHFEATENVAETLNYIRSCGIQAGLAFCPETSATFVEKFLDKCDLILMMTVHPGFGGQAFIPDVLEKIRYVRSQNAQIDIQVDGGINLETAAEAYEAGANVFVAGTHLFKQEDMGEAILAMRGISGVVS